MRRDSACELKSPILRRGLAHYRLDKSLRPRLESGDFSSTILESQSSTESTKQGAAAVSLVNPAASDFTPKHTQSHDSISKILESQSVDKQHTQILESAFYIIKAFFSSLRDTALAVAWQSKGYRSPLGDVSLESIQVKTQTLESKSGSKSHKTRRSRSFFSKSTASRFKLESAFSLSSRADEVGVAIHTSILESTLTKLDSSISTFLNLIYFTQAHFLAVFFSPFLWLIGLTPRSFMCPLLLAPCSNFSKTNALFATAECVDCHADFQSARNDRNNATFGKVDSRSKAKPIRHDSKHCGGAVVALRDFGGRARLEVCGCPQNRAINRIAYPRLNRRQRPIPFFKEYI